MNNSKYYPLALEALVELAPEIAAARTRPHAQSSRPTLGGIIGQIGPLPDGALFLGMADDGLPVLLNLYDPSPGPLLITGDEKAGKTILLKTVASAISNIYSPDEVQFSAATFTPDEWEDMTHLPHCAGVIAIQDNDSIELITSLYDWAHENQQSQQVVLFLVDGLEHANEWDENTKGRFRWLLMRGPSRRVWPILTVNSNLMGDVKEWLSLFRIFIYGKISNSLLADTLTGASRANLDALQPAQEFSMKEGNHWLRFWIPRL